MPAVKRPAAAMVKSAASKAAKLSRRRPATSDVEASTAAAAQPLHAEVASDPHDVFDSIKETLRQTEDYPQSALEMLVIALPFAAVPKEQRHDAHGKVLDMIQAALDSHVAAARGRVEAADTAVGAAAAEWEARQHAVDQTKSAADAAAGVLVERKADLATVLESVATAQSVQSAAEAAEAEYVKAAETVFKRKAGLQTVQARLDVLRAGSPEPSRAAVAKDVAEALKAYNVCDSLLVCLSALLPKKPAEIGAFDQMVFDQLEADLQKLAEEFERKGQEAAEARDSGARARLAATAGAEAAKEKAKAAAAEIEAAESDVARADEALKLAAAAAEEHNGKVNVARERFLCLEHKLNALKSGAIRRFQEVRDLSVAPKPEEALKETIVPEEHATSEEKVAEPKTEVTTLAPGSKALEETIAPEEHAASEETMAEPSTEVTALAPGIEVAEFSHALGVA